MSSDWKQKSLTPVLISENDPSYKTVDDLLHALADEQNLNIAVTGPYGSGKSSVLKTLMTKASENYRFLDISLATLDADESLQENNNPETQNNEVLNRKIEYSILLQLVYRETLQTLPFSRLKKIRHLSTDTIKTITSYILGFFICICIAFCPSFLMFDKLFHIINFPEALQLSIRMIAVILLIIMLYDILKYLIKNFGGVRLERVKVGGNEINMNDEGSIFNRYLDEILYFFQCTEYNVVIIEDLDRFNTTHIFLKLRELNYLINKSKIVNRKIRFVYAVKDDMFKDASRSKFFDYITTVIPIITTSNSKDKLREALMDLGHESEVSDERIRDIAFHIDDMRLLYNITNEYHQYSKRLNCDKDHLLDSAKMLAMIAVKNYYPHDFSLLHKREGKIYNAISKDAKQHYVKIAIEQKISKREDELKRKLDAFDHTCYLSSRELRLSYLMQIVSHISQPLSGIEINGKVKSILEISDSEEYFNKIIKDSDLKYYYLNGYGSRYTATYTFKWHEIEKNVCPEFSFEERIKSLSEGRTEIEQKLQAIEKEKIRVQSLTVKDLLLKFNLYEDDYFRSLNLAPMVEDFIRTGLIAEDYSDYISYFYPGMMSLSDHQLCLDMRLDRQSQYDNIIDDCETFLAELPDSAFQYKSVLNIQLLDYLALHHVVYHRKYELIIDLLLAKHPVDFLVLYANEGEYSDYVWNSMMEANSDSLWLYSGIGNLEERTYLYQQWITHCKEKHITKAQIIWANEHYDEMAHCYPLLSVTMQDYFIKNCMFSKLSESSPEMLKAVVDAQCYSINEYNMPYVVKQLGAADDISKLPEQEEKELAVKLDLIKPSWGNILAYYKTKGSVVDEFLFKYVDIHIKDLNSCPDEKDYAPLFQSLLENNNLTNEQYKCICELSPFYITITDAILKLSEEKLILLVETAVIEESVNNFESLKTTSPSVLVAFLRINDSIYNECINAVDIDESLARVLLSEPSFNLKKYEYVIQKLDSSCLTMTPALADLLCSKMSLHFVNCDLTLLSQAIAMCKNKVNSVQVVSRAAEALKDDAITTDLLKSLGDKYARLTELHISETFEDTPTNIFLAKVLQVNGYISSYSSKEGKLKVNTKKRR